MLTPPFPKNESARLAALKALSILDTLPEDRFDRITGFARELFQIPIALISLVDTHRQWFKSRSGLDAEETPREVSFCGHAILADDIFVVEDAMADPRFADNPLVTGPPFVLFYAGMPLAASGFRVGTLCLIDHKPRHFSNRDRSLLKKLAAWAERELTILGELQIAAVRLESQARLESVLNGIADGVITADCKGFIQTANPAAAAMFGHTTEAMLGRNIRALIPQRARVAHDGYMKQLNQLPDPVVRVGMETIGLHAAKGEFPVELTFTRLNLGDHSIYSGILRDLSERKGRALIEKLVASRTRSLSESEMRTRAIVENIIDGIVNIDEHGTIETVNSATQRLFGYSEAEMIGNNVKMLMPEPYQGEHDEYLKNYMTTGTARIIGIGREVVGRRKDGSIFPMELAVSEVKVEGRRMFTGIVRDISERKRIEKMKSEFISTVSHELRTPLTSIRGALGLVVDGFAGEIPATAKTMISIAHNNSERLVRLINDILDIEKIEAGKMTYSPHPIGLRTLLEQAVADNMGYAAEHGVFFEIRGTIPDLSVNVDRDRIMQVLANLLSNAAKFSPSGGTVVVSALASDKTVRVSVADSGPGIPLEFQNRIFGKFAQADSSDTRQKGGTGLGLSIAKAIVEMHGGTIGFSTQAGDGTDFFFDLPVWVETATQPVPLTGKPFKARVLICEDDRDIATLLSIMLNKGGYLTDIASTAEQAKQMLADALYDAMTLDLALPDQDGISLIRELRSQPSTVALPIIVISARAEIGKQELSGDAAGVIDWLGKPIDLVRLEAGLKNALQRSGSRVARILHIEDDPDILSFVASLVGDNAALVSAGTLGEASRLLSQEHFDLILLDLGLPDGSGEGVLPFLHQGPSKGAPVIIFSADDALSQSVANVERALVKSRTTNDELLRIIKSYVARDGSPGATR